MMKLSLLLILFATLSGCVAAQSRSAAVPQTLVGQWFTGNTSTIEFVNRDAGSSDTGGGDRSGYVFRADGSYVQLAMAKAGLYGCSTVIFDYQPGTFQVEGSTITLTPTEDYLSYKDSCNPHTNSEKQLTPKVKVFEYRLKTDDADGREYFCISAGGGESCYARAQDKN